MKQVINNHLGILTQDGETQFLNINWLFPSTVLNKVTDYNGKQWPGRQIAIEWPTQRQSECFGIYNLSLWNCEINDGTSYSNKQYMPLKIMWIYLSLTYDELGNGLPQCKRGQLRPPTTTAGMVQHGVSCNNHTLKHSSPPKE